MAKIHFTCAQVAKLVRAALKESFPGIKFSVRSQTYSMGASVYVSWIDGPTEMQVESITKTFHGAKHDSIDDSKQHVSHTVDGEEVAFGADRVNVHRSFSDALMQEAIDALYAAAKAAFDLHKLEKPTIARFMSGELWNDNMVFEGEKTNVQEMLRRVLHNLSRAEEVTPSATLARVKRNDGEEGGRGHA